jgi:hypothetical protein
MAAIGRQALTALLPVRAGREALLSATIAATAPVLTERLEAATTVHFARLVVVPSGEVNGSGTSAWLLFETTYDGDLAAHVAELFVLAGRELGRLLAECDGVSASGGFEAFEATLRRGSRRPWAFSAQNDELGVTEIRHDAMLRESVAEILERERSSLGAQPPLHILQALRRRLGLEATTTESAPRAPSERTAGEPWLTLLKLVPLVLGMVLHDVRERVLGLWHDRTEPFRLVSSVPHSHVPPHAPQRAFTHLALPKPGRFRRGALRKVLAVIGSVLEAGAAERSAPALHTHRFVLLDDGRLLFTNQQDGSLTSFLSALDRRRRALLALVWSCTEGFPRALFGHLLGKTDDDHLLEWLRARELAAGFCYSAYPKLTVRDVAVNAELRALLTAEPTDARARRLLELV